MYPQSFGHETPPKVAPRNIVLATIFDPKAQNFDLLPLCLRSLIPGAA